MNILEMSESTGKTIDFLNIMRIFKKILTAAALLIAAVALSSCYFRISDKAKRELKYEMRYLMHDAEGEVDTVTYNPGEFHSVRNDVIDDVVVIQTGNEYKVEVISYDMMTDSIRVTNEDGVLTVGFTDKTSRIFGPTQVLVYTPTLTGITSTNFGNLRLSGFKGDSLSIETAGAGNIKAYDLKITGKLTVRGTGSGDHEFRHVDAGEMVIDKKGSGDGEYRDLNVGTLSVTSTGSGNACLSGKAGSVTFHKTGSGDIDASELKAKHVETQESGSGDLIVNRESVINDETASW